MSALIGSVSELLTLLVQSFNLSAVFPALVFMLLNYLFVFPKLKDTVLYTRFARYDQPVQILLWVVLTVGLAYFLTSVNTLIIRWFEGYPLIHQFPFDKWRRDCLRQQRRYRQRVENLTNRIAKSRADEKHIPYTQRESLWQHRETLVEQRNQLLGELLLFYPVSDWRVLPTRLGNVLAAAEDHPQRLFGIDAVTLWPYLGPVLTQTGYAKFVEREKAVFDLLLNSTVLTGAFGLVLLTADYLTVGRSVILLYEFGLVAAATAALHYFTIQGAIGWGTTIRAAYALHRKELREHLGLSEPQSYDEERALWKRASQFYREPYNAGEIASRYKVLAYQPARVVKKHKA